MSSSTAFARALSPSLEGLTNAIHNISSVTLDDAEDKIKASNDRLFVLQTKIAECRTVEQVINTVYSDYCLALREHLFTYASWCEKKETVKQPTPCILLKQRRPIIRFSVVSWREMGDKRITARNAKTCLPCPSQILSRPFLVPLICVVSVPWLRLSRGPQTYHKLSCWWEWCEPNLFKLLLRLAESRMEPTQVRKSLCLTRDLSALFYASSLFITLLQVVRLTLISI